MPMLIGCRLELLAPVLPLQRGRSKLRGHRRDFVGSVSRGRKLFRLARKPYLVPPAKGFGMTRPLNSLLMFQVVSAV